MNTGLNIGLWIAQVSLLGIYGAYGVYKTFFTEKSKEKMAWTNGRTDNFIRFVGIAELLGGVGVVLPMLTGILPWLTVLSALGLTLIQGLAIFTEHLPKKEYKFLPLNLYFAAMSIFVVIGRWSLFS
ncbi:MAG: DoxX family protein [Anaerolineales bacterium]|nr:DoxX family protein [Anaerolineales bacterium]